MDYEQDRRLAAISKRIAPTERLAFAALRRGDFDGALAKIDDAEAQRRAAGVQTTSLKGERIEAYFGKRDYEAVLALVGPAVRGQGALADCAKGISLMRLGRLQEAREINPTPMMTRYLSKTPTTFLPGTADAVHLEASFWLARGLEYFMTAEEPQAKRELLECVRLVPGQPYASYLLADLYLKEHDSAHALPFARAASVLPGLDGKEAQDWVWNIEH